MNKVLQRNVRFIILFITLSITAGLSAQDKFPVPTGNPNQLFYLQRTANTNTIVVELNYKNNVLDEEEPVHVYWLRYTDQGQKEELNYIQRKFAYGIKSRLISQDKYELNFVSYKKYPMYLMKGANNKYNVYGTINQKQAIVNRIFVKINGGALFTPNVEYVEIKGVDPTNGKEVIERRKI
jgi:hypothetical protein